MRLLTFETFYHSDDLANKKTMRKTNTKTMTMTNTFREHPQRGIFEDIREHPQMAILVLSLTIDSLFQTKIMGVDQILQFRPNFTILEYLEYLEYLEFNRAVS